MPETTIAVIQMNPGLDRACNLDRAAELLAAAAERGARLAVLPEMFSIIAPAQEWRQTAEPAGGGIETFLSGRAAEHRLHIVGGSYIEEAQGTLYNTCPVFAPDGTLSGRYRKMHLFWTDIPGETRYDERAFLSAGEERMVFEAEGFRIAVGICYDLRFPEFFRDGGDNPPDLYCLGAAFMEATGRAHWETLVRARAIENLAFFAAAGTVGEHYPLAGGMDKVLKTYGHSMIVSPWGEILDEVEAGEGIALAEVDSEVIAESRARLRALDHVRRELWRRV